ncbi:hypothetical protein D9623_05455 [Azospirillum brasilense]|uniref:Uncharacterized protein n=1 Tax=Azospirillum brasilense TaxID=192 RepID=A0A0P0EGI6_AZOBR|nr:MULTISPECIES: hypothetical protein [Azospirillum]ALJ34722.1 hypothetical protein AMK58_04400 [Azospirillum brasilense]MDW7554748.1 hypothetical protein [Azospirillum brasilense]MDW7557171.1 hypothetical protein [Azospirillum brasilense]MDW7593129.1 hypothetical protein [Azospirillum brasilense]MDW7626920.1 hypothetical protein [Azospirillum brasilense]
MLADALVEIVTQPLAKATVDFVAWKPRLAWLFLALVPGGIAATGTLTGTALALIALASAPAALALRWAARRLW